MTTQAPRALKRNAVSVTNGDGGDAPEDLDDLEIAFH